MKRRKSFLPIIVLIISMMTGGAVSAGTRDYRELVISEWLQLGPVELPLPAFHNEKNMSGSTFAVKKWLDFSFADVENWWPGEGEVMQWDANHLLRWEAVRTEERSLQLPARENRSRLFYLAAYVHTNRFTPARLTVKGKHLFKVFWDGNAVGSNSNEEGTVSKEIDIETGTHLLLIKVISDPDITRPVTIGAQLSVPADFAPQAVTANLDPTQVMTVNHLLDGPKVTGVAVSPDGKLVAVSLRQSIPPSDESESWIELRSTKDGSLVQSFRGGVEVSQIRWAPVGKKFFYTVSGKKGSTLWVVDLESKESIPLLEDVKHLNALEWSPDGTFIIYSITEKAPKEDTGLKRLLGMVDRWPNWRDRSFLYRVNYPSGTRIRLTAGKLTTSLNAISPDAKKLVFSRVVYDYSERPYSKTQFFLLNLQSLQAESLFTCPWSGTASWAPDGKKLLVTGGPSMFGKIGVNVPEGMIPNEYDTQAYLYDLQTGTVEPITHNFDPAINQAFWSQDGRKVYFVTTDRSYGSLFQYDVKTKRFEKISLPGDVIHDFSLANGAPIASATVSGVSLPPRVVAINLKKRQAQVIYDPGKEQYERVAFGRSERWTFTNERGVEIEGRVYYPPDFDPQRQYPCIVYYYGGTSPVSRDFGGRYPKELWAANGYVVYVLQPGGATGFGQAFSALHVNDWGKIVAGEIIEGTKKFLKAHPFVDPKRVGCIGASFGGFMTMYLQTQTDMFTAAVAHAGISSISSYWGEGYWGFLYSAIATANSFPWNRRDIYVDRSPLFLADKVKTPILLLHGTADTNVPPGESIQFYTALKLLGKTVELIEVEGQNHHILAYGKRKQWTKTILAWFDRWLKDQPEWWNRFYPEK